MTNEKRYTINQLAAKTKLSAQYIRKSIHKSKLESTLVNITPKVQRHEITMTQFNKFRSNTKQRTSRDDGRNKFHSYFTPQERNALSKLLKANKLEKLDSMIVRANQSK